MRRSIVFVYGVLSYALFLLTFLYAIGFMGNFLVPTTLDGDPTLPLAQAALINVLLLTVFAVQHSVMARPAFKAWLTRFIPKAAERSTYVLCSNLAMFLIFAFWQPMGGVVWNVENETARAVIYGFYFLGLGTVLVSTFLINHFDLFGLRQVWLYFRGQEYTQLPFTVPGPYRFVRHPLYVGWLMSFWFAPTMTVAHLLFALMTTAYILVAIQLEERDLVEYHPEYADYRQRVPMLIPGLPNGETQLQESRP